MYYIKKLCSAFHGFILNLPLYSINYFQRAHEELADKPAPIPGTYFGISRLTGQYPGIFPVMPTVVSSDYR